MRTAATMMITLSLLAGSVEAQMKKAPSQAPAQSPVTAKSTSPQGSLQAIPVTKNSVDSVKRINVGDAYKMMQEGKAVMVDVRSNEQFKQGHIAGALSIPGSQLIKRFREIEPRKLVITYCACSAEQSSGKAVVDLNAHGVKNTAALLGGWAAWQKAGLPTK